MLTGRRYRLALTPGQAAYAETVGDACRAVWNTGLEQRRTYAERYRRDERPAPETGGTGRGRAATSARPAKPWSRGCGAGPVRGRS